MVVIDDSLQYLQNLQVDKNNALLSGIVESVGVTHVEEMWYNMDALVQTFEYSVLSQSIYNHRKTFSYPVFPRSLKWHLNENTCTVGSRSVL